jgi:Mce-associated membrane protein
MSPKRRIDPHSPAPLALPPEAARRRGLPGATALAGLVVAASIAGGSAVLINHEITRSAQVREVAVLSSVRSFITQYTSLDPFHANDYADRVLAQGTGEFAKMYGEKMNAIVIQVARAEPSKGTVQDLGIERWNDDGSANVVVAALTSTKMPDGKVVEAGNRWLVTATKEGEQWKISSLVQVI